MRAGNGTTSKRILRWSWTAAIILTTVAVVAFFKTEKDISPLVTMASLAWGALTAAQGFYYWKAKNENRAKGAQKLVRELADKYGIENAARFAELIFKD